MTQPTTLETPAPSAGKPAPAHPHRLTFRRMIELCVFMSVLVLLVRTFVAEAYIVPTGSMAPALVGYHKSTICPKCRFPITVGHLGKVAMDGSPEDPQQARRHYALACCPNCGWDRLDLQQVVECAGDRLLVHKHVFDLRPPRRWELVVFQHPPSFPPPAPGEPYVPSCDSYIKRLVGMPGETVQVRDGDLYINGNIQRKSLDELREMRVLIYDDDHVPIDAEGWFRWGPLSSDRWRATSGSSTDKPFGRWLPYIHSVRQIATGGKLVWRPTELRDDQGGNGGKAPDRPIHDILLEAEIEVTGNGWLDLAITDGHDDVLIHLPVGTQEGKAELRYATSENWNTGPAGMSARLNAIKNQSRTPIATAPRLAAGGFVSLQLGLVDRRLFLKLGDQEVFAGGHDLPQPAAGRGRRPMSRQLVLEGYGPVSMGPRGETALRARHLRLFRDVHYTDGDGRDLYPHGVRRPATLGPDEYFVLGDNSGNSYDSRCWPAGPAVRHEWLVGKPFLLHLPTQIVELGQNRTLALPDWQRMKLLR